MGVLGGGPPEVSCDTRWVDTTQRQVVEAAEARALALANRDSNALEHLLHEDFRWISHTGEMFSRDDYISRNTAGSVKWRSQRLGGADVVVVGETAVLCAEVIDVVSAPAGDETARMPMTQVWVRQNNRWRCLAGHAGPRRT